MFIAFLGLIAGAFLLYQSIFIFRSAKLSIVVAVAVIGGLLITRLQILYDNVPLDKDPYVAQGIRIISQQRLDDIQNKIVMYKKSFGNYPESLSDLKNNFSGVYIEDPLLTRQSIKQSFTQYYYKKTSSTSYTLFSAGLDAIPNTADDLHPQKLK